MRENVKLTNKSFFPPEVGAAFDAAGGAGGAVTAGMLGGLLSAITGASGAVAGGGPIPPSNSSCFSNC